MTNTLNEQPTISQILGTIRDFAKNYYDMKTDNTIDGDKYFHCKANFEAARRGSIGHSLATFLVMQGNFQMFKAILSERT